MEPAIYIPQSTRLLEQLREVLCYRHYSLKTEQAYPYWVRFFVRWCARNGPMRHPRDMGAPELTLCPYSIMVYATAQEPGKVVVAYRRVSRPDGPPASKAALKEVDALQGSIAREALGIK